MNVTAQLDWETSERAGAGGLFQVISLEDENGDDITGKVDQGVHYTIKQLERDLSKTFGTNVTVEEV